MIIELEQSTLKGKVLPPPSKSMAHRMLICATLSHGFSQINNLEYSVDILTTIHAMSQLGAKIECKPKSALTTGLPGSFAAITRDVNCEESGSTLRFIIPLFSLIGQTVTFTGAPRLFERPLAPYEKIFSEQNLGFALTNKNLVISGALSGGNYALHGNVSSQFISGLLLALPLLEKDSTIHIEEPFESQSYVELTRKAQEAFGVTSTWKNETTLFVPAKQCYKANDVTVEGDWSQAAVFAVLAAVCGGIDIEGMDEHSPQGDKEILNVLKRCGAKVVFENSVLKIVPPMGGLQAAGDIDVSDCPDLGPILCTLALFCKGTTRLVNAQRLRLKESDRIACMENEFHKIGANVSSTENSITIQGGKPLLSGKIIQSHNDHRIVMALSAASLCANLNLRINDAQAIRKSWPTFFKSLIEIGAKVVKL